jgi:hypothetical protein
VVNVQFTTPVGVTPLTPVTVSTKLMASPGAGWAGVILVIAAVLPDDLATVIKAPVPEAV